MFDREMVKKNSLKKKKKKFKLRQSWKTKLDLENFWSKTKLDLENFHQFFFLQKALKCHF